jgi:hypothetical protein
LEPKVVYELILSHGRTDLYLFFAGLNRDHGKVVEHWVTEEQWLKAIDTLNGQVSHQISRELWLMLGLDRFVLPLRIGSHATST